MDSQKPCPGGQLLFGMNLGDYYKTFAFDLDDSGCVLSSFFSDLRHVLDVSTGLCVRCGGNGELMCRMSPFCHAKKATPLGSTNAVDSNVQYVCKESAFSCGVLGMPPCKAGAMKLPDANGDGCEDYLKPRGGACVACQSSSDLQFGHQLCGYMPVEGTTGFVEFITSCGELDTFPCPVTRERPWGCKAGFIESVNGTCEWTNCGADFEGAQTPCDWSNWPHVASDYQQLSNGCHPMHNLRDGKCVRCGLPSEQIIVPTESVAMTTTRLRKELLTTNSKIYAYWNGTVETPMWLSRCDLHGCGFEFWPALHDFNKLDLAQATSASWKLNPDLQICAATYWTDDSSAWTLKNYFSGEDLGFKWMTDMGIDHNASLTTAIKEMGSTAPPPPRVWEVKGTSPLSSAPRISTGYALSVLSALALLATLL